MRGWLICLVVAACANDGTRARCAEGGALTTCPDADRTPEAACWRLVDCAAIPAKSDDGDVFDWDHCMATLESFNSTGELLAIDCIRSSTCDQLKVHDSATLTPHAGDFYCVLLGNGGR